jgi:hypothetical protein
MKITFRRILNLLLYLSFCVMALNVAMSKRFDGL